MLGGVGLLGDPKMHEFSSSTYLSPHLQHKSQNGTHGQNRLTGGAKKLVQIIALPSKDQNEKGHSLYPSVYDIL